MLALVDGHPRVLNLKEVLGYYLDHRLNVIVRRTQFELNKAEARAHILEGLLIALDHSMKLSLQSAVPKLTKSHVTH